MNHPSSKIVDMAAAAAALVSLLAGAWAMAWPSSFFSVIAPFPPYNQHLIHDIGALQIGLGSGLLASLAVPEALLAALVGSTAGAIAHFASHLIDRGAGGHPSDPFTIGAFAVLLAGLTAARWTLTRRSRPAVRPTDSVRRPVAS